MIHHVALWTSDAERLRDFYCSFFGARAGERYENPAKGFVSYFVRFPGGRTALEVMCRRGVDARVPGEPRETGDGYFESVVADPDGNRVELVFDPFPADGARCK